MWPILYISGSFSGSSSKVAPKSDYDIAQLYHVRNINDLGLNFFQLTVTDIIIYNITVKIAAAGDQDEKNIKQENCTCRVQTSA